MNMPSTDRTGLLRDWAGASRAHAGTPAMIAIGTSNDMMQFRGVHGRWQLPNKCKDVEVLLRARRRCPPKSDGARLVPGERLGVSGHSSMPGPGGRPRARFLPRTNQADHRPATKRCGAAARSTNVKFSAPAALSAGGAATGSLHLSGALLG